MMKKLEVVKVDNYIYTLKDTEDNKYNVEIVFIGMKEKPQVGDNLYLNRELLNKKYVEYSDSYCFGPLNDTSGRKITDENSPDLVVVQTKEKRLTLKRLYG